MEGSNHEPAGLVLPDISIYDYGRGIYKIVRFKRKARRSFPSPDKFQHYDHKLDSSLSRARKVVLELALCNDWKYFCTFTLDPKKYNRSDLDKFHKDFTQWLRNMRKAWKKEGREVDLRFVLVPELHADSESWHIHALFSDISFDLVSFAEMKISGENVPQKLVDHGYLNWKAYQDKFGFCSFGLIENPVACAFYIVKYVGKGFSKDRVGQSLYYPSRPLNRSQKHGDIYGYTSSFDEFLTNNYDFCDTGMTHVRDGCDWTFGLQYMDCLALEVLDPKVISQFSNFPDIENVLDQLRMEGYF